MAETKVKVPVLIFNSSSSVENIEWLFKTLRNVSVQNIDEKELNTIFSQSDRNKIIVFNYTSEILTTKDFIQDKIERLSEHNLYILTLKRFCHEFSTLIRNGLIKIYHFPDEQFILRRDVEQAVDDVMRKKQLESFRESFQRKYGFDNIIGNSEEIKKCIEIAKKVSKIGDANVLLLGETGTGKELFARAIHYNSPRATNQFVEVNTSAIPEHLFESELFGYEKGAFTDAKTSKIGLLELAEKGTIFFDEIGDLSQPLQVKLLRAIENKVIRHLGGLKDIKIDCRIISATNQDMEKLLNQKKFREDLYYRLKVIEIYLPPLRERSEDIIPIAEHYIKVLNEKYNKKIEGFRKEAKKKLLSYSWPGNVRELQNVIEKAVVLSNSKMISEDDIHLGMSSILSSMKKNQIEIKFSLDDSNLRKLEKRIAEEVLKLVDGNKTLAAKKLGISRPSLLKILNED